MEARLSIRIDPEVKMQAENVFQKLGLTMSSGVNIFLSKVVTEQGIPFPLTLGRASAIGEEAYRFEIAAANLVREELSEIKNGGKPIARYDAAKKRPYLEYPDGHKEYNLEEK